MKISFPILRTGFALFVVGLFVASWLVRVPGNPLVSGIVAFVPVMVLMVTVEFFADADCKLSNSDRWRIRRAPAGGTLLWRRGRPILLSILLGTAALLMLSQTRHPVGLTMAVLRLAAGVALLYALAGFIFDACGLCFWMAGYSLPLMHRAPIAARSVGDFWAQRWNMVVSAWHRRFVFWPLARRRFARLGVLGCFAVSGLLHAWPMLVALGASAALSTMAFFLSHGLFVLIENRLRVDRWPIAAARGWTLLILLASSPLYIDPGLRLFGF